MATILFNHSSTASSTTVKVSVAEALTVEVSASAIGQRPSGPINPLKVSLKLGQDEISSSENNSGNANTDITATAEASVGMSPGQLYTLQLVGTPPPNGKVTKVTLIGTVIEIGHTRPNVPAAQVARVKRRKSR